MAENLWSTFFSMGREDKEGAVLGKRKPWRAGTPAATNTSDCCSVCWSRRSASAHHCWPSPKWHTLPLGNLRERSVGPEKLLSNFSQVWKQWQCSDMLPSTTFCENGQLGRRKSSGYPKANNIIILPAQGQRIRNFPALLKSATEADVWDSRESK